MNSNLKNFFKNIFKNIFTEILTNIITNINTNINNNYNIKLHKTKINSPGRETASDIYTKTYRGKLVIFDPAAYNVFASKNLGANKIKYFFELT